jgi:hypothetical protein
LGRLTGFLALPPGIPSHDTFYRVFARLDPRAIGTCVADWMAGVCEAAGLRHIAIDGKAVRSAPVNTFSGCLHLVSAGAAENRPILGQAAAAGCQKEIAKQVREPGGHYRLAVKGNQPAPHDAV